MNTEKYRSQMRKTIKNILQKEGVFCQRFHSPESFYEYVREESMAVQFFEVKRIARSVCEANNHNFYEGLLKLFVPNWDVKVQRPFFLKKGYSRENINTYRGIGIEGNKLFEKVFDSNSTSLKKNILIEKIAERLSEEGIEIPRCRYLFKGEILTIGYYDFIDDTFVPKKDVEAEAAIVSMLLFHIPINVLGEVVPEYLFNYKRYSRSFSAEKQDAAIVAFEEEAIRYDKIEKSIEAGRWVVTHGGLKYGHLYKNRKLIDWDEFGIYPAGMEQAIIFFENIMKDRIVSQDPLCWLNNYYCSMVPKEDWMLFKLSFLYFLFIFGIHDLQKVENAEVRQCIVEGMKDYKI